jgi:hypothetical protein
VGRAPSLAAFEVGFDRGLLALKPKATAVREGARPTSDSRRPISGVRWSLIGVSTFDWYKPGHQGLEFSYFQVDRGACILPGLYVIKT